MYKINVGVLRGGPGLQYERSLKSGASVLRTLADKYQTTDVFISKGGVWHTQGFERSAEKALKNIDAVVNTIYGEYGEDGSLSDTLESLYVPYVGSKKFASALSFNKLISKDMFKQNNINTPMYRIVSKEEFANNEALNLFRTFPQPSVVKPISGGGSIKTKVCQSYEELENALSAVLADNENALVEEYIGGVEAICTILEGYRGQDYYALTPFEVIKEDCSTLESDKINCNISGISPSRLSPIIKKQLEEYAEQVHKVFGMRHISKTDFIVNPRRGIYALETNAVPDLYENSSTDVSLNAVGSSVREALDHMILNLALKTNSM